MKKMVLAGCLLSGMSVLAQNNPYGIKDTLLAGKDEVLAKHLPYGNKQLYFASYVLPPDAFLQKIADFKKEMGPLLEGEKDAKRKELKQKDLDYYTRVKLKAYTSMYGLDSVNMMKVEEWLADNKGTPTFMEKLDSVYKTMFVKKLSPEEKNLLDSAVSAGGNHQEAELFKLSAAYRQWIDDFITKERMTTYKADTILGYYGTNIVKLRVVKEEFADPFMKEYLSYGLTGLVLKMVKDSGEVAKAYSNFMALVTNKEARKNISEVYANMQMMASKAMAPDFTYATVDDKKVSLSDLKGKYVYIDVWATWCGPCKAEIPFLQKIEKEYHGKNIHFVSLSVDRMADKGKWISYVKDHQLGGIQLMADKDFNSDFIKKFNIAAIPRFILIDPKGAIVSGDAARPSDPALKTLLDSLL